MLFTYNKPSQEIIDEINKLVKEFYPKIIPEDRKEPICKKILAYNGITDACAMERQQAMVVFNYHASKAMQRILSNKYAGEEYYSLDETINESQK